MAKQSSDLLQFNARAQGRPEPPIMSSSLLAIFEQYQKARVNFVQAVAEAATRPQNIDTMKNAGVMQLLRPLLLDNVSQPTQLQWLHHCGYGRAIWCLGGCVRQLWPQDASRHRLSCWPLRGHALVPLGRFCGLARVSSWDVVLLSLSHCYSGRGIAQLPRALSVLQRPLQLLACPRRHVLAPFPFYVAARCDE